MAALDPYYRLVLRFELALEVLVRRSSVALLVILAGLVASVSTATAAVVAAVSWAELADEASLILIGDVTKRRSAWRDGRIVTTVSVRSTQTLKGVARSEVQVEVLGGIVDGIGQRVSGMAQFELGEQVALFLRPAGAAHRVIGLAQGKLRITKDKQGILRISRHLDGLTIKAPPRSKTAHLKAGLSLKTFVETTQALVRR